jgi:hypothetical protein
MEIQFAPTCKFGTFSTLYDKLNIAWFFYYILGMKELWFLRKKITGNRFFMTQKNILTAKTGHLF